MDKLKLKPYMAFSREEGPQEAAVLVLAHTAKEARKLAWRAGEPPNVDGWIDQAVLLIRNKTVLLLANQEKLAAGEPHIVRDPIICQSCGLWGSGLDSRQLCAHCGGFPGAALLERMMLSR